MKKKTKIFSLLTVCLWLIYMSVIWGNVYKFYDINTANQCKMNHRKIGRGCSIYAFKNNGKFPPDLLTLFNEEYVDDIETFQCHFSKGKDNRFLSEKKIEGIRGISIIYLPGLNSKSMDDSVLTFCEYSHFGKGRFVGFADGHVEWASEKKFIRLLKKMLENSKYRNQYSEKALNIMNKYVISFKSLSMARY